MEKEVHNIDNFIVIWYRLYIKSRRLGNVRKKRLRDFKRGEAHYSTSVTATKGGTGTCPDQCVSHVCSDCLFCLHMEEPACHGTFHCRRDWAGGRCHAVMHLQTFTQGRTAEKCGQRIRESRLFLQFHKRTNASLTRTGAEHTAVAGQAWK